MHWIRDRCCASACITPTSTACSRLTARALRPSSRRPIRAAKPAAGRQNEAAMAALQASLALAVPPGRRARPRGTLEARSRASSCSASPAPMPRCSAAASSRTPSCSRARHAHRAAPPAPKMRLVLDTQVWLDWLVFDEPTLAGLRATLAEGRAEVVIDSACLAELERVLAYPLGRSVDVAACLAQCLEKVVTRTNRRSDGASSRVPRPGRPEISRARGGGARRLPRDP